MELSNGGYFSTAEEEGYKYISFIKSVGQLLCQGLGSSSGTRSLNICRIPHIRRCWSFGIVNAIQRSRVAHIAVPQKFFPKRTRGWRAIA
jgi:hypothetical protein